ncbi:hypothetical protein [Maribellus sp. YY47]|uniref:hypothetical protein n=1 Tax=Maribellus sp. YY47 TaxID=2929486 RepID=UPI0020013655|nr:hypothetical protein [Maribellus sp. YY47]MCK3685841.1 hypothetical protein [Maribellus sp. YY47]
MKSKKLKRFTLMLLLLPLGVLFLGAGCEKEDVSQSVLNGKWILIGFGDDSTNEFTSEPNSEPKSSYVIFDNGRMVAYSVSNMVEDAKYVVDEERKIIFSTHGMKTLIGGDTEWGQQFLSLIIKIYEFEVKEDELKLYYESQKYMKLKKDTK